MRPLKGLMRGRPPRQRRGSTQLFTWRYVSRREKTPPVEGYCPHCDSLAMIEGRVGRRWVQLFGIPVMPLEDAPRRFSACQQCRGVIPQDIDRVRRRAAGGVGRQRQIAIEVYNDLRERPGDAALLFKLLELYGLMGEYHEAVVTAMLFPEALHRSPDCLELLSRLQAMERAGAEVNGAAARAGGPVAAVPPT